jgi:hypothetical protein
MSSLEGDLQVINPDAKILITAKERFKNMNPGIYLVVQTPRAGKFGHRYISSSIVPTEKTIVDIFTKAGMNPVGANYISISIPVIQTLPGSVRQGNERIVLIGVNTQNADIVKIKAALLKLFVPLDQLINGTDWEKESNKIICFNPILEVWISGEDFQDLPVYKEKESKRPIVDPSTNKINKKLVISLVISLVIGLVMYQFGDGVKKKVEEFFKKNDPIIVPPSDKYIKLLLIKFGCDKQQLEKELRDYKKDCNQDNFNFDSNKLEEYAKEFFDDKSNINQEKYAIILNTLGGDFKTYYNSMRDDDYKEIKQKISKSMKIYISMRTVIGIDEELKNTINTMAKKGEFLKGEFDSINAVNYEAKTPLLNKQDKLALDCFKNWMVKNKEFLEINPNDNFSDYIRLVSKNKNISIGKLNKMINALKIANVEVDKNDQKITFAETAIMFINSLSELNTNTNK